MGDPAAPRDARSAPTGATPPDTAAELRARDVVTGVLAEALRARGCGLVVVAALPSPERDLLVRWLASAGLPCALPDPERARTVASALSGGAGVPGAHGAPAPTHEAAAVFAVASTLASDEGGLVTGVETRTHLLLEGARARVLPFGDLSASLVGAWAGGVRLPAPIAPFGADSLGPVDRALERFLDDGATLAAALEPLPRPLATALERILRGGAPDAGAPLVPKLGRWTPGLDLAL